MRELKDEKKLKREFVLDLVRPYKAHIALLLLLLFLASAFEGISIGMLVPLLAGIQQIKSFDQLPEALRSLIEIFSTYPIETQILLSLTFVVGGVVLKNIFLGVSQYLAYWLTARLIANLRMRVVNSLVHAGMGFYNTVKTGDLVERTIYNTVLTDDLIKKIVEMAGYVMSCIILLVLLVIFSWKLTLVSIVLAAVIAYAVSIYIRRLSSYGRRLVNTGRELTSSLHETLSGIQVIKSFTKEDEQIEKLNTHIENHARHQLNVNFTTFMVHVVTEAFGIVAIGVLFLIAIKSSAMDYRLVLTQILPFIYIIARILPVLKLMNQTRGIIVSRLPAFDTVFDLLRTDNKPQITDGEMTYSGLKDGITFEDVTFAYDEGEMAALSQANFFIPKGKTTAIVGKSGAGKSTVINLLLRFYDPQSGRVLIDGKPLPGYKVKSYLRHVGMVSQDTFIFNDTVRNNIAFGLTGDYTDDIIVDAAKRAGADEFITALTEGYDTMLGERGIRLSGGQRQRISIARATLKNPEILILDEATSSLDTATEQLIHRAITELSKNRTVIIIAHRFSTIKNADQIIVLKDGGVVESGCESDLMKLKGEFYRLATTGS